MSFLSALSSIGSSAGSSSISSAIGSAAVSAGASMLAGPQNLYLNKHDRAHSAATQWNYYLKQKAFDYNFDKTYGLELARLYDQKDYELAKRYSENSASWAVEGLRKAGLNPILAAGGGFNPDMGFQGQGPSGAGSSLPSISGGSVHGANPKFDIAAALRDIGSLDVQSATAAKLRADTNVAQAQADNIRADTLKKDSEIKSLDANVQFGLLRAMNDERSGGLGGMAGLINKFANYNTQGENESDSRWIVNSLVNRLSSRTHANDKTISDKVGDFVGWLGSLFPTRATQPANDAKELRDRASPLPYPNPQLPQSALPLYSWPLSHKFNDKIRDKNHEKR